jgi:hypothetical protein
LNFSLSFEYVACGFACAGRSFSPREVGSALVVSGTMNVGLMVTLGPTVGESPSVLCCASCGWFFLFPKENTPGAMSGVCCASASWGHFSVDLKIGLGVRSGRGCSHRLLPRHY